jgi:hypothetical protein
MVLIAKTLGRNAIMDEVVIDKESEEKIATRYNVPHFQGRI